MKIFGIGTDIIQISRIKKSIKKEKFFENYSTRMKLKDVKKQEIHLIVLLKDLLQKKLFQRL